MPLAFNVSRTLDRVWFSTVIGRQLQIAFIILKNQSYHDLMAYVYSIKTWWANDCEQTHYTHTHTLHTYSASSIFISCYLLLTKQMISSDVNVCACVYFIHRFINTICTVFFRIQRAAEEHSANSPFFFFLIDLFNLYKLENNTQIPILWLDILFLLIYLFLFLSG